MMRDGQRASRQDEDVRRCLWVGPIVGANRSRIPACWDELLDWTIDASQIFDLFLQTRSSEANVAEEQEGNSKSNAKINFVPYALHTQAEHIRALPSMEYCDQEKFLFENVSPKKYMG